MFLLVVGLTVSAAAQADSVWCAVEDESSRQGFVTDLRHESQMRPQDLRKLASRFRRTVNERFGTAFTNDAGLCQSFPNQPKAESHLATRQASMQARGLRITAVGVF